MKCSKNSTQKFKAVSADINKEERSHINNLTLHLQKLVKEELNSKLAKGRK